MSVNFAAVHDKKPWRKHKIHQTLHAAIDGKDGAKSLLLRVGRVADMWSKYGDVRCVFVWEDGAEIGHVFRLDPERSGIVQSTIIAIDRILLFHKSQGCSAKDIAECFGSNFLLTVEGTADSIQNPDPETPMLSMFYPDDLPPELTYIEGAGAQILVNRFERSLEARNACIAHHGSTCQVCELNFSDKYGELGAGFIHVHHRVPIASVGTEYCVDPINDLVPVCPNCHAMLHQRSPAYTIEELREIIGGDT